MCAAGKAVLRSRPWPWYPRWEEKEGMSSMDLVVAPAGGMLAVFPREIVLSGGIKVGPQGQGCGQWV